MNVFILALGTRGDLAQAMHLGQRLSALGHRVTLGTSGFYRACVCRGGLDFLRVGSGDEPGMRGVMQQIAQSPDLRERAAQFARDWLVPQLDSGRRAIDQVAGVSDYIVNNMMIELARGGVTIPGASIVYDPPNDLDVLRAQIDEQDQGQLMHLVAAPRELIDPDGDWPAACRFTGFWLPGPGEPSPVGGPTTPEQDALPGFVLTLGSMHLDEPHALAHAFDTALGEVGGRGIIVGSQFAAGHLAALHHAEHREYVAYEQLFERAAGVFHHGGCGTIARAMAGGAAHVVLPQLECQRRFAQCLARQGLLAGCYDSRCVTAGDFAQAMQQVRHSARLRDNAAAWKTRSGAYRGLDVAVGLIQSHAQSKGLPTAHPG